MYRWCERYRRDAEKLERYREHTQMVRESKSIHRWCAYETERDKKRNPERAAKHNLVMFSRHAITASFSVMFP